MLLTRLETDPAAKLKSLPLYRAQLSSKERKELIKIAINKAEEQINERVTALDELRDRLEKLPDHSSQKSLTDEEVQILYKLIKDEAEFPIVVYPEQFTVEQITHKTGHEDLEYKSKITKDIEENDAMLRARAALLIVDFGQGTKKYRELKHPLVIAITAILGNMLGEPDNLFLKETKINGNKAEPLPSSYFKQFVEALYFIDETVSERLIKIFRVNVNDFSFQRRERKHLI